MAVSDIRVPQTSMVPPRPKDLGPTLPTTEPVILCLGRFGDIINALPIAWELAKIQKKPIKWIVAQQFSSIFDGVSYVSPIIFHGDYSHQSIAKAWAINQRIGGNIINCATYGGVDRKQETKSYQAEAWRIAGWLKRFGEIPTVFDRRDLEREDNLVKNLWNGKPFILVNSESVSSPIRDLAGLKVRLEIAFPDFHVVDLSQVRCERIYDLIGLFNRAKLLITVDSMQLHLVKAATCPVISIINDGWKGSVPPPNSIKTIRYGDATIERVVKEAQLAIERPVPDVFHVVWLHGDTERHQAAKKSWEALIPEGLIPVYVTQVPRDARSIGDKRDLPYLKDLLSVAMEKMKPHDVVIWTNSDIQLDPKIISWAKNHVGLYGAATMRRKEIESDDLHCGRDLMAFTKQWLMDNWKEFPDYLLGEHQFDLGIAAMVRFKQGIVSTLENIKEDRFPAETSDRFCLHIPHEGGWLNKEHDKSTAKALNAHLFNQWRKELGGNMRFW